MHTYWHTCKHSTHIHRTLTDKLFTEKQQQHWCCVFWSRHCSVLGDTTMICEALNTEQARIKIRPSKKAVVAEQTLLHSSVLYSTNSKYTYTYLHIYTCTYAHISYIHIYIYIYTPRYTYTYSRMQHTQTCMGKTSHLREIHRSEGDQYDAEHVLGHLHVD